MDGEIPVYDLGGVLDLVRAPRSPEPRGAAVASLASLLIPGWGQLLNGNLVRSGLLLVCGPVEEMLIAYQLYLPPPFALLASDPCDGRFLFPLEVTAPIHGGKQVHLAGGPGRFELAFSRYRVFLYNESDKAARVDLHLYASL